MSEHKLSSNSVVKRNEDVLFSEVADGMSLMDIDSGKYFHFDQTGCKIWKQIDDSINIDQLCAKLKEEFDVDSDTCRSETMEFLEELSGLRLINIQS